MLRKQQYNAKLRSLARSGNNFEEQVRRDTLHLITKVDSIEELTRMTPCISQALNFFIIEPMCSHITAREMISKMVFGKNEQRNYMVMREDKFNPSELVAAIAYMFRQIALLHFMQRGFVETAEFQHMMAQTIQRTEIRIIETFPGIKVQWESFLEFFVRNYLTPWNTARYSDWKTSANFGTGVDYITIPPTASK